MEIFNSFRKPSIWAVLALEDLRDRYKRSLIGMVWIPVTFLMFVGVKILVFSKLNGSTVQEFATFVMIGYWVWQSINSNVIDSSTVFIRSGGFIKSSPLPYSIYVFQSIFRNNVVFFYNFVIILFVYFLINRTLSIQFLYVIPAYVFYVLNAIWVGLLLGTLAARFRDIVHLLQSLMRITFFLTPVIWIPQQLGPVGEQIAFYNPFSHFIALVRFPLINNAFPWESWCIVVVITVVGWIIGLTVYNKARPMIIHWV